MCVVQPWLSWQHTEQRNEAKRLSSDGSPGNGAGYVLASWLVTVLVIEMVNVCGSALVILAAYRVKE
jgi:hypothetical protein